MGIDMKLRSALPWVLLLASAAPAMAIPVTVGFEATGFVDTLGSASAPQATVTGQVVYDWDPTMDGIQSLTSLTGLAIDGTSYTLTNVVFLSELFPNGTTFGIVIGGDAGGEANVLVNQADDFELRWFSTSGCEGPLQFSTPLFSYTKNSVSGIWVTSNVQFTISGGPDPGSSLCSDPGTDPDPDTDNRVPEPGTLALLGLGLAGLAAAHRRRR